MSTTTALVWGDPDRDVAQSNKRMRFTMLLSILVHLCIAASVVFQRTEEMRAPVLTQITLIDPTELEPQAAAAAAPAAAAVVSVRGLPRASEEDAAFRRSLARGDVAPEPQADQFSDQLNARLSELRGGKPAPVAGSAITPMPSALLTAPAAVVTGGAGRGSNPMSLKREGPDGPALELAHGPTLAGTTPAAMKAAEVRGERATEAAPVARGEVTAQRTLAGASLAGPIADRAVVSRVTPVYPDWAKRDAVEGSVTLFFVVKPDGAVKENILVQKTAGFEDFDESARSALRNWRFEPLRGGRIGEQWGTITFRFRLQDT